MIRKRVILKVVQQITAVRAASDSVIEIIIEDLVGVIYHNNGTKNKVAAMELKETIQKIL